MSEANGHNDKPPTGYVLGLDLGQAQDYSALAVLARRPSSAGERLDVVHLHRWPLGTSYTSPAPGRPGVVEGLRDLLAEAPGLRGSPLAVDQTGVGRAVVDVLRHAGLPVSLWPVTITSGHTVTQEPDLSFHVGKKHLVSALQVVLQKGLLRVAPALPLARVLQAELGTFKAKITAAGNETFESWRERDHDDLVLAVALACWLAQRMPTWGPNAIGGGGGEPSLRHIPRVGNLIPGSVWRSGGGFRW